MPGSALPLHVPTPSLSSGRARKNGTSGGETQQGKHERPARFFVHSDGFVMGGSDDDGGGKYCYDAGVADVSFWRD